MDIMNCHIEILAPCYSCGGTGMEDETKEPSALPGDCITCHGTGKAPMKMTVQMFLQEMIDELDERYQQKEVENGK